MDNKIIYITKYEAQEVKMNLNKNIFFAEIFGEKIETEGKYAQAMANAFAFPHALPEMKIGWYNDYICDLTWIEQEDIILLIHDYDLMLADDLKIKKDIIADFEEIILPWWGGEVVRHMVGVKPRNFLIYLEGTPDKLKQRMERKT
ncbi:MAG: barstar family protein [Lachnospiraceae bacterium]|nr:barstar family protein [Lachnospiraceae bacterium]